MAAASSFSSSGGPPRLAPLQVQPSQQQLLENCADRIGKIARQINSQIPIPSNDERVKEFTCSISTETAFDPVATKCKHLYERKEIERWVEKNKNCPICRDPVEIKDLEPCPQIKNHIVNLQNEDRIPTFSHFKKEGKDQAKLLLKAAKLSWKSGDYEEALKHYSAAFKYTNQSKDYTAIPKIYESMDEPEKAQLAYLHLAQYQFQEGKVVEAFQTLEACEKKNPKLKIDLFGLADKPEKIAEAVKLGQKHPEAVPFICKQVVRYHPGKLEVYELLWPLLLFEEKKEVLLKFDVSKNLVKAMAFAQKHPEMALVIYRQVVRCFPAHLPVYERLWPLISDPDEKRELLLQGAAFAMKEESLSFDERRALAEQFCKEARSPLTHAITAKQWAQPNRFKDEKLLSYFPGAREFLEGECTLWPGNKRSETHDWVILAPRVIINDEVLPFSIKAVNELDQTFRGLGCMYPLHNKNLKEIVAAQESPPDQEPKLILIPKKVIPKSRNKSLQDQLPFVPEGYEVPEARDAAAAILLQNRSLSDLRNRRFKDSKYDSPDTGYRSFINCKNNLIVGGCPKLCSECYEKEPDGDDCVTCLEHPPEAYISGVLVQGSYRDITVGLAPIKTFRLKK